MNKKEKKQQEKFLKSLDNIYCRVASTEHGVGVIAVRDIPINTNPFKENYAGEFIPIEPAEVEKLDEGRRKLIEDFCPHQDGYYYVPEDGLGVIDVSFYLNSSKTPNMRCEKVSLYFFTLREIKAGEELTVDYETYSDKHNDF